MIGGKRAVVEARLQRARIRRDGVVDVYICTCANAEILRFAQDDNSQIKMTIRKPGDNS